MQSFVNKPIVLVFLYVISSTVIPLQILFGGNVILISIIVILKWLLFIFLLQSFLRNIKVYKKEIGGLLCAFLFLYLIYFLSTVINASSYHQWFSSLYCNLSNLFLFCIAIRNKESLQVFLKTISTLYSILASVNILLIYFDINFGIDTSSSDFVYMLGRENLVVYPLVIGFFYHTLNYHYNTNQIKVYLYYTIIMIATIFEIWSGTSVLGTLILFICLFTPFSNLLKKIGLFFPVLLCFVLEMLVVAMGLGIYHPSTDFANTIVESFLGKDMTFSGRIYIWETAFIKIIQKPLLGYGVPETGDLFSFFDPIYQRYTPDFSTHNEFIFLLYKGGAIALVAYFLIIKKLGKKFEITMFYYKYIVSSFIISISWLYIGEEPSMNSLFEIIFIGYILSNISTNQIKTNKNVICN